MSKRAAAAMRGRARLDLAVAETVVVRIGDDGVVWVGDNGRPQLATSAIPGMVVHAHDRVLTTETEDGRVLLLGVVESARPSEDVVFR